jgi:1-acyl-sn-glycerol-3-phosphate acyltransferase
MRVLLIAVMRNFFRLKCYGQENLPAVGGGIIASNHISYWDPPVVGSALPSHRKIHFMAKAELFEIPIFGWIVARMETFPIRRGFADRNAIKQALALLAKGELLGIFPEGTRSKTGKLGKILPGLPLLAIKAGVPIIPAALTGTNQVLSQGWKLPRFVIIYGTPIYPQDARSEKENIEYIQQQVTQEMTLLLEQVQLLAKQ